MWCSLRKTHISRWFHFWDISVFIPVNPQKPSPYSETRKTVSYGRVTISKYRRLTKWNRNYMWVANFFIERPCFSVGSIIILETVSVFGHEPLKMWIVLLKNAKTQRNVIVNFWENSLSKPMISSINQKIRVFLIMIWKSLSGWQVWI